MGGATLIILFGEPAAVVVDPTPACTIAADVHIDGTAAADTSGDGAVVSGLLVTMSVTADYHVAGAVAADAAVDRSKTAQVGCC